LRRVLLFLNWCKQFECLFSGTIYYGLGCSFSMVKSFSIQVPVFTLFKENECGLLSSVSHLYIYCCKPNINAPMTEHLAGTFTSQFPFHIDKHGARYQAAENVQVVLAELSTLS
jgi:hypothetical protein